MQRVPALELKRASSSTLVSAEVELGPPPRAGGEAGGAGEEEEGEEQQQDDQVRALPRWVHEVPDDVWWKVVEMVGIC